MLYPLKKDRERTIKWAGYGTVLIVAAALSLLQDLMGLERYVQLVRDHWISPWVTVPLALSLWLCGVLCLAHAQQRGLEPPHVDRDPPDVK
jgi:hypothetical protein